MKWIFGLCLCLVLSANSQAGWIIGGRCEQPLFERCAPSCQPLYYCDPIQYCFPKKEKEDEKDGHIPYVDANCPPTGTNAGYGSGSGFSLGGSQCNSNLIGGYGSGGGGSGNGDCFSNMPPKYVVYCPPTFVNCPPVYCPPPVDCKPPVDHNHPPGDCTPPTSPVPAPTGLVLGVVGLSMLLIYRRLVG
jgi:hypothetical protein